LERQAAQASGSDAQALLDKANALTAGQNLPENPLVAPFEDAVVAAQASVVGAFYQINDGNVINALVAAKSDRNVDVRLGSDADFMDDPAYTDGFKRLAAAGIPVSFDTTSDGRNRAPLMHHKFLSVDQAWLWAGSFNPIEDDPARIHADNVLLFHSPALAKL